MDGFDLLSAPQWKACAVALAVLGIVAYLVHRRALAAFRSQSFVDGDKFYDEEKRWGWLIPFGGVLYLAVILLVALYAGGATFTFLAGGAVVYLIFSIAHSVRTAAYYRILARPNAARGTVWVSKPAMMRASAQTQYQGALFCFLTSIAVHSLALLGGAALLLITGMEYGVRAKRFEQTK